MKHGPFGYWTHRNLTFMDGPMAGQKRWVSPLTMFYTFPVLSGLGFSQLTYSVRRDGMWLYHAPNTASVVSEVCITPNADSQAESAG